MVQLDVAYESNLLIHNLLSCWKIYVDDATSVTKTIEQGKEFFKKAKLILSDIGFNLRKCVPNDSKLQNFLYSQENSKTETLKNPDITFFK